MPSYCSEAADFARLKHFFNRCKSSELLRLRARLEQQRYLVVYIDALDVLELQQPIEHPEVLTHIGLAVDVAMTTLVKAGKATAWARNFGQEIKSLLGLGVRGSKVEASAGGAGLGVELRHNDAFRQCLREAAKNHRHQFLSQAGDFFADAERLLLRHGYAGLVVIFGAPGKAWVRRKKMV